MNGKNRGILFRRCGEFSKALMPNEVRNSHIPNKMIPVREITISVIVTGPKNSFIFSRIFIDISFHNIEKYASLYYIRSLFSREIDYGQISY